MTRKDFELLAKAISLIEQGQVRHEMVAIAIAHCRATNPRFDAEKFRAACIPAALLGQAP
jgi:hypothetical protein